MDLNVNNSTHEKNISNNGASAHHVDTVSDTAYVSEIGEFKII